MSKTMVSHLPISEILFFSKENYLKQKFYPVTKNKIRNCTHSILAVELFGLPCDLWRKEEIDENPLFIIIQRILEKEKKSTMQFWL